jgi:hypothetical protein
MTLRSPFWRTLTALAFVLLTAVLLVGPAIAKSSNAKNDRDRMPNGWEKKHGLNVRVNDAHEDPDADLLKNIAEFRNKTDPQDPDSDDDGFTDGAEVLDGFDPTDPQDNLAVEEAEELAEGAGGDEADEEGDDEE